MGQLQLTAGEQGAFADAARELRFADGEGEIKTPITAAQLLRPRRDEDANGPVGWRGSRTEVGPKQDLWHTMNVVQENVIKGGLHAHNGQPMNTLEGVHIGELPPAKSRASTRM